MSAMILSLIQRHNRLRTVLQKHCSQKVSVIYIVFVFPRNPSGCDYLARMVIQYCLSDLHVQLEYISMFRQQLKINLTKLSWLAKIMCSIELCLHFSQWSFLFDHVLLFEVGLPCWGKNNVFFYVDFFICFQYLVSLWKEYIAVARIIQGNL